MIETVRRRRIGVWLVLATAMLLIGSLLAWRYRPLNRTERLLVGTWHSSKGADITLLPDRTFTPGFSVGTATWSAWDEHLKLELRPRFPRSWGEVPAYWKGLTNSSPWSATALIEVAHHDQLRLSPQEVWNRVRSSSGGDPDPH